MFILVKLWRTCTNVIILCLLSRCLWFLRSSSATLVRWRSTPRTNPGYWRCWAIMWSHCVGELCLVWVTMWFCCMESKASEMDPRQEINWPSKRNLRGSVISWCLFKGLLFKKNIRTMVWSYAQWSRFRILFRVFRVKCLRIIFCFSFQCTVQ